MLKAIPACAIMISCYEAGKRFFGQRLLLQRLTNLDGCGK